MKYTLAEIPKCKGCQMELLPFLDVNGKKVQPTDYCDDVCKNVYTTYKKWFDTGRQLDTFAQLRYRPRLDLRL